MNIQDNLTNELKRVLECVRNNVVDMYPCDMIDVDHILFAILDSKDCVAYRALANTLIADNITALAHIIADRLPHKSNQNRYTNGEDIPLSPAVKFAMESLIEEDGYVNSGNLLAKLIPNDKFISKQFQELRLTPQRLKVCVAREIKENFRDEIPERVKEDKKSVKKTNLIDVIQAVPQVLVNTIPNPKPTQTTQKQTNTLGEMERHLDNLNKDAFFGKIPQVLGKDKVYKSIFQTLLKSSSNNVVLTGDSGCGKTAVAKHIANMLIDNQVPISLRGKTLLGLTLPMVLQLASFRGMVEAKFKELAEEASQGNSIILIDDIATILGAHISEMDTESLLETLAGNDSVMLIVTCSDKEYGKHLSSSRLGKLFHRINVEAPSDEVVEEAVRAYAEKLEVFHNILYSEDILASSINIAKNWNSGLNVIDAAVDLLDEAGAQVTVEQKEDSRITELKEHIEQLKYDKSYITRSQTPDMEEKLAEIEKQIANAKAKITKYEKEDILREPTQLTKGQFLATASDFFGVDIEQISADKKKLLRGLNDKITKDVIGQDKAVEEVCRIVRRKRVGLGNRDKPTILFFGGSTGTGKTYLAKKIAEHVFGSEKNMVRLDMSEYADKMSINKLYGSAHGYVGFENGGVLTNAIRGKKNCVLLLDEIEKAHSDVFDVFLQVFDEGRLTDNKGRTVDFKDVIIIMTSNVGAVEVAERGKGVGFVCSNEQINTESIVKRALQRKFKPEFINRIDSVVFFNDLGREQLKKIIGLEIEKVGKRLAVNGYSFDKSMTDGKAVDRIDEILRKEDEKYNARSIARTVQKYVEDSIVDYIIDHDIPDGHEFTYDEVLGQTL